MCLCQSQTSSVVQWLRLPWTSVWSLVGELPCALQRGQKNKIKYLNCGLLRRGRRFQAEGTTRGVYQKDKKVQSSMESVASYSGLFHCNDVARAGRGSCWWQAHRRPFCHAVKLDLCLMEKGLVIPRPYSGVCHAQICILIFCTSSIVNLQCCTNLCYVTKWLNYAHTDILFLYFFH